jgi:ABC-type uncharacterized transport system involved in gliding motility auxiliary subunit
VNPLPRKTLGGAAFLVLLVLFVGLNVVFHETLHGARLDLTANRLYSLAPGTTHLVGSLREPVHLYFYFSRTAAEAVPQLRAYANRVQDLLEEIAARSNGKVLLEIRNPERYSEDEDRAAEAGLRAAPVGAGGQQLYFGLVGTNSTDGRSVVEFFDPQKEELLEYDVARLLHQLATTKRPSIGLTSTLPLGGGFDAATGQSRPPTAIYQQMSELFELHTIPTSATELPAGLDALMVVQPKGFAPALQLAIDEYLRGGGKLLLFVDPDAQLDRSGDSRAAAFAGSDRASTFEPFFKTWGIDFDPRVVLADQEHALLVGSPAGGEPIRHLGFLGMSAETFAAKDPVTAALDTITFATPGFLGGQPVAGLILEPLISSSTRSAPIPTERFGFLGDPRRLSDGFKPTGQRYVIAARLAGTFPTAFPGGPPAGATAKAVLPAAGHAIVVADTDVLADMLWIRSSRSLLGQPIAQAWASNGDFVLNALDNLSGSADLIGIRGRASFSLPFRRVEALREHADERLRAKEVELQRELAGTEQKLVELQSRRQDQSSQVLTAEQTQELERFQQDKARIRKELRDVHRGLDVEIERLGTRLKLINIVLVPLLVALGAILVAVLRRRRAT